MSNNTTKKRNWTFVLYPESAPKNWLDILSETGLPFAVSPLHEYDVDPTGEIKKAHYHIILCYDGPTTYSVVERITTSLNQPHPQFLDSVKGYYRYFTHKDNPDKYQYNECDIRCFNGFNILDYGELTNSEILALKRKILTIIRDNKIFEYSDLIDFLFNNDFNDLLNIASNHTIFFNAFLKSKKGRNNTMLERLEMHDETMERLKELYNNNGESNNSNDDTCYDLEKRIKECQKGE